MKNEVYLVDSVARAVEWAQSIAQRQLGHFGRIRKVKPGEIIAGRRTVKVQLQIGDTREWFVVNLKKTNDGWVVEPKEEKKMAGTFEMSFNEFLTGLRELMAFSDSACASILTSGPDPRGLEYPECESEAVANLARNVLFRPTGNGVGWDECALVELTAKRVHYRTSGGLEFGWSVDSSDFQEVREIEEGYGENYWRFFVRHPRKEEIRPESTLRRAALARGWTEEE